MIVRTADNNGVQGEIKNGGFNLSFAFNDGSGDIGEVFVPHDKISQISGAAGFMIQTDEDGNHEIASVFDGKSPFIPSY